MNNNSVSFGMALNYSKNLKKLTAESIECIEETVSMPELQNIFKEKDVFIKRILNKDANPEIRLILTPKHKRPGLINRTLDRLKRQYVESDHYQRPIALELRTSLIKMNDTLNRPVSAESHKQKTEAIKALNKLQETVNSINKP